MKELSNNNLPKGWRKVKLGEIANIKMGQSPSSQFYNSRGEGLPFYQGITDFGSKYPNRSVYCTNPIKIAEKGEILFSVRAPVGEVNIATEKSCIGRGIAALSMKNKNNEFLYYLLKYHTQYFKSISGGTTYESIGKDQIAEIEVVIPEDPNEQKRIADILSAFDDKIEVNNKIIKTLEEMAQEIFKEWFVRFRFPGWQKVKFVDSELGKIPEGWEIGYLGDGIYSEIIKPRVKKFEGEKIYLATADVEKNEIVNEKTKISYNSRPIRANMEPVLNSIWFAKMINTYKVLFFFEGNKEDIEKYILSTGFMGIQALKNMQYYLYLLINSKEFHQIKDTLVQGAVQEAITNTNVKQIKFLIPPANLLDEFNKKVEPLLIKVYKLKKENQKLAELRDLLLPKLMSGEIRV
jgi:type I restriction enzyme S subunit